MRGAKTGQSWSMDLVIGVVIFGFMSVIFYSLLMMQDKPSVDELQQRAQVINQRLEQPVGPCGPIVANQTITSAQLRCLYDQPYNIVKQQLGVDGEFCIYVEDSKGNLYIINTTAGDRTGFGNPALIVGGVECGVAT